MNFITTFGQNPFLDKEVAIAAADNLLTKMLEVKDWSNL